MIGLVDKRLQLRDHEFEIGVRKRFAAPVFGDPGAAVGRHPVIDLLWQVFAAALVGIGDADDDNGRDLFGVDQFRQRVADAPRGTAQRFRTVIERLAVLHVQHRAVGGLAGIGHPNGDVARLDEGRRHLRVAVDTWGGEGRRGEGQPQTPQGDEEVRAMTHGKVLYLSVTCSSCPGRRSGWLHHHRAPVSGSGRRRP